MTSRSRDSSQEKNTSIFAKAKGYYSSKTSERKQMDTFNDGFTVEDTDKQSVNSSQDTNCSPIISKDQEKVSTLYLDSLDKDKKISSLVKPLNLRNDGLASL